MTTPENTPETTGDTAETKDTTAVPSDTDTTIDEITESTATDVEPGADEAAAAERVDGDVADTEEAGGEEPGGEEASGEEPGAEVPAATAEAGPGTNWPRILAFIVLPVLALILGGLAGFLKWQDSSVRDTDVVRAQSVQVAKDATVRLLSYKPDTVEQDLNSARELLTGEFRDSYTQLINDVVIPGSKEKQIAAVATVPAAASVSAEPNKAVVLVFVNQTVVVGTDAPTGTTSSVQVTMERAGDQWLVSEFDPV